MEKSFFTSFFLLVFSLILLIASEMMIIGFYFAVHRSIAAVMTQQKNDNFIFECNKAIDDVFKILIYVFVMLFIGFVMIIIIDYYEGKK